MPEPAGHTGDVWNATAAQWHPLRERVLVLPHMQHRPAHFLKLTVFLSISFYVALKFAPPPITIVPWKNAVVRAGVPETSVNEYRYPCGGERNIRSAGKPRLIDPETGGHGYAAPCESAFPGRWRTAASAASEQTPWHLEALVCVGCSPLSFHLAHRPKKECVSPSHHAPGGIILLTLPQWGHLIEIDA